MSADEERQDRSCEGSSGSSIGDLGVEELEEVLVELLVAKYPGIEQRDIDRLFWALDVGAIEEVEQIEADMALKSAQWRLAALDLDQDSGEREGP